MKLKNLTLPFLLAATIVTGCSSATAPLFSKKTPLEKYEDKLEDLGLENTPEGKQWKAASERALQVPVTVSLPYRHNGRFSKTKPQALGLSFAAKQGQHLSFNFTTAEADSFVLYAELYKLSANGETSLIQAVDTNVSETGYDVPETGNYVLKLQPQLFRAGTYNLSISTGPSLGFPVAGSKAYIGSVWGDDRDGGKRSHEGVDIFAAKRTPAVAAADGFVTAVREGGIGGKTVWLRPKHLNVTLYYAHLDEQLVYEGQEVRMGDTLGLVGNTGNAKYTPSHLHFGIYGFGGAVDPFPFVNKKVNAVPAISQSTPAGYVRTTKDVTVNGVTVKKNTPLLPLALTAKGYIAELPDGRPVLVSTASIQQTPQPLTKRTATAIASLYASPSVEPTPKTTLPAGTSVLVLGYFNDFMFVRTAQTEGWVLEATLKG